MISLFNCLPSVVPIDRVLSSVGLSLFENNSAVRAPADEPSSDSTCLVPAACSSADTSPRRRANLQQVFNLLDENGDGVLSVAEVLQGLKKLDLDISEAPLRQLIESGSNSNLCHLRFNEFNDLYDDICKELALEDASTDKDESQDLREAFRVFDKDEDGFICATELQSVLSSLGFAECKDIAFCRDIVHRIDANGDGLIDFSEFKQMMSEA